MWVTGSDITTPGFAEQTGCRFKINTYKTSGGEFFRTRIEPMGGTKLQTNDGATGEATASKAFRGKSRWERDVNSGRQRETYLKYQSYRELRDTGGIRTAGLQGQLMNNMQARRKPQRPVSARPQSARPVQSSVPVSAKLNHRGEPMNQINLSASSAEEALEGHGESEEGGIAKEEEEGGMVVVDEDDDLSLGVLQAKRAASIQSVPIFKDCDPAFLESCSKLVRQMS